MKIHKIITFTHATHIEKVHCSNPTFRRQMLKISSIPLIACNFSMKGAIGINQNFYGRLNYAEFK